MTDHQFRMGTRTLHYTAAGSGDPLVLLHGLSGSGRWWGKNISALARRYRVYALDLPGFGGSRGQPFSLDEAARLVSGFIDTLDGAPLRLMAHSMGGLIAERLALRLGERLRSLVLVDALGLPLRRSIANSTLRLPLALHYAPVSFWPVLAFDALRAGPLNLLRATWAIHRADLSAELAQITCPTLVVWGEHDMLVSARFGQRLHAALPGARWALVKGAGHNPMWDRAEAFNRLVVDFLDGPVSP